MQRSWGKQCAHPWGLYTSGDCISSSASKTSPLCSFGSSGSVTAAGDGSLSCSLAPKVCFSAATGIFQSGRMGLASGFGPYYYNFLIYIRTERKMLILNSILKHEVTKTVFSYGTSVIIVCLYYYGCPLARILFVKCFQPWRRFPGWTMFVTHMQAKYKT